jgi:hypothetical protein
MTDTYIIKKIRVGDAYPKNGNLHNPTIYYKYQVYKNNNLLVVESRLKAAKQFIADDKQANSMPSDLDYIAALGPCGK